MSKEYQNGQTVRIPTLWVAAKWSELKEIVDKKVNPVIKDVMEKWEELDQGSRTNPLKHLEGEFHEGVEGVLLAKVGSDQETNLDIWSVEMTYYKDDGAKITEIIEFTTDYFIESRDNQ